MITDLLSQLESLDTLFGQLYGIAPSGPSLPCGYYDYQTKGNLCKLSCGYCTLIWPPIRRLASPGFSMAYPSHRSMHTEDRMILQLMYSVAEQWPHCLAVSITRWPVSQVRGSVPPYSLRSLRYGNNKSELPWGRVPTGSI